MKYFAMTIMVFSSMMLWDGGLHAMDKPLAMSQIGKKPKARELLIQESLERFNKAFEKTWSSYVAEDDDDEPTFRLSIFNGPADSQQKEITQWLSKDFREMLWHLGDYDKGGSKQSWCTDNEHEALTDANHNFVKLISNGIEHPICIDEELVEKTEYLNPGYPVTVLNIDTDTSSLSEELFAKEIDHNPMTIVINEGLILNGAVVQVLRDKLEPLGELYKAHKVLQQLDMFKKEQPKRLFEDTKWPKELRETVDYMFSSYLPDVDNESLIRLCFFDSLQLDQQRESIRYWMEKILMPEVEKSWMYKQLIIDLSKSAIKLVFSDKVDCVLLSEERKNEDFTPNTVMTILNPNSADDVNELLSLLDSDQVIPTIIGINETLLKNEEFVNSLFKNLIRLKDKGGVLECLEMLAKKCPNSKCAAQVAAILKSAQEKQEIATDENTAEESSIPKKDDNNNKRWFSASRIFAHPLAKYIGIPVLAGSSIVLLILLNNYLKSFVKSAA